MVAERFISNVIKEYGKHLFLQTKMAHGVHLKPADS
jgi:hypothetical protein